MRARNEWAQARQRLFALLPLLYTSGSACLIFSRHLFSLSRFVKIDSECAYSVRYASRVHVIIECIHRSCSEYEHGLSKGHGSRALEYMRWLQVSTCSPPIPRNQHKQRGMMTTCVQRPKHNLPYQTGHLFQSFVLAITRDVISGY